MLTVLFFRVGNMAFVECGSQGLVKKVTMSPTPEPTVSSAAMGPPLSESSKWSGYTSRRRLLVTSPSPIIARRLALTEASDNAGLYRRLVEDARQRMLDNRTPRVATTFL